MTWFEALAGFPETSYAQTQGRLRVIMGRLVSEASTRSFEVGALETPSLGDLLARTAHLPHAGRSRIGIVRGDVRKLHADPDNAGALFQVASQFNLLQMVGPDVSPEDGRRPPRIRSNAGACLRDGGRRSDHLSQLPHPVSGRDDRPDA
jgi:hypothetical protein